MGKTVLSRFLLEYFENLSPPRKTVHFFFSDRDSTRRSPINFLKAAIHQFIQHSSRSFTKYVKPRLDKFGPEVHTSLGLLWDIFYEMTQDSSLGPVVCVLDALDEADPKTWEDLIKRLGNNFSHTPSSTHFKFIITSRPYNKINTHFSRFCVLRLRAENEDHHIHQDITLFVEAEVPRLAEHRKYPENLQKMVKDALITGSGGMFLWVHLMLAILWQTPVSDVRQRLEQAPKDIDAVYDRIIAELSPQLADTATKILKWLVFGNRPFTVEELSMVSAVERGTFTFNNKTDTIAGDLDLLSPLLRVKGNRVYLVHHTAKEYLLKLNASTTIGRLLPPPQEAHSRMAMTCLDAMDSIGFENEQLSWNDIVILDLSGWHVPFFEKVPAFLRYVASQWAKHLESSCPISTESELWQRLLDVLGRPMVRWVLYLWDVRFRKFFPIDLSRWPEPPSIPHILLYFSCQFALQAYAQTHRCRADDVDGDGRQLLHLAAEKGCIGMLRALDLSEMDINKRERVEDWIIDVHRTALHVAAFFGWEDVTNFLLEHGADPVAEQGKIILDEFVRETRCLQTALHIAAKYNHHSVIKSLLDTGRAEVNAVATTLEIRNTSAFGNGPTLNAKLFRETTLSIAIAHGHQQVARLLLENGAKSPEELGVSRSEWALLDKRKIVGERFDFEDAIIARYPDDDEGLRAMEIEARRRANLDERQD
jgi:hypothetical protein